jgi:hypothetical protein
MVILCSPRLLVLAIQDSGRMDSDNPLLQIMRNITPNKDPVSPVHSTMLSVHPGKSCSGITASSGKTPNNKYTPALPGSFTTSKFELRVFWDKKMGTAFLLAAPIQSLFLPIGRLTRAL